MSATEQALSLPEILTPIFDVLLAERVSLSAVVCVSSTWFECGTQVLWRRVTSGALGRVKESRRQLYAGRIEELEFYADQGRMHYEFRHLRFNKIRKIQLDSYRPANGESLYIYQYFRPTLKIIYFLGGELDDDLLEYLGETCWRLQELLVDNPGPKVTATCFLKVLSNFRSLSDVTLLYNVSHLLTDELILHFAARGNLTGLRLGMNLQPKLLKDIEETVERPFPVLQTFNAIVPSASMSRLSCVFSKLTSLELSIEDSATNVLMPVSNMTNLESLRLTFNCNAAFSAEQLLLLGALNNLEQLSLAPGPPDNQIEASTVPGSPFTDNEFKELVSKLPRLQSLEFEVQCDLTIASLLALARHCPLLEECDMLHAFDLGRLDPTAAPLFPTLKMLALVAFRPTNETEDTEVDRHEFTSSAAKLARLMTWHFPLLQELYVRDGDSFSELVADMHRAAHLAKESQASSGHWYDFMDTAST